MCNPPMKSRFLTDTVGNDILSDLNRVRVFEVREWYPIIITQ
jgi:hypothetical protein